VRFYETTVLWDPKIGEEEIEKNLQKVQTLITAAGGEIVELERKGVQKLSYRMKKTREAYFTFLRHNSKPESVKHLKEQLKLNEAILRFGVVLASPATARVPLEKPAGQPATA
jgi:small subunit ribosomal protein S6